MKRASPAAGYQERVDIIGNQKFLEFVDDLEKLEELQFGTFQVGKERLKICTLAPQTERSGFDLGTLLDDAQTGVADCV